jgi:hypothetical protein
MVRDEKIENEYFTSQWYIRRDILEFLDGRFRENPDQSYTELDVMDTVTDDEDNEWILAEFRLMEEEGLLKLDFADTSGARHYLITSKGIKVYKTTYNKAWVTHTLQQKRLKIGKERSEKIRSEEKEDKRFNKQIEVQEKANKYNRIGIFVAIGLGAAGLIVAILKP